MKRWLQFIVASFACSASPLFAITPSDDANLSPVLFPVVLDQATVTGGDSVAPGNLIYSQSFRSVQAVRLKTDYALSYKTVSRLWGPLLDKNATAPLKAGTLFVFAVGKDGPMFCAAAAEKKDDTFGNYDIGVCMRDDNSDGIFDRELVIDIFPWRVRAAYEIIGTSAQDWRPVSVPYETLAREQIPTGALTLRYDFQRGGVLSADAAKIYHTMCFPVSAPIAPSADNSGMLCGELEWPSDRDGLVPLQMKGEGRLQSGTLTVVYEILTDKTLKVSVAALLKSGNAFVATIGRRYYRGNTRSQYTIFRLAPLSAQAP